MDKIINPLTGKMVGKAYYNSLVRSGKIKSTEASYVSGKTTKLKSSSVSPPAATKKVSLPPLPPLPPPAKTSNKSLLNSASSSAKSSSSKSSSSKSSKPDNSYLLYLFPEDVQEYIKDQEGGYDIYDYLEEMLQSENIKQKTYDKYIKRINDFIEKTKTISVPPRPSSSRTPPSNASNASGGTDMSKSYDADADAIAEKNEYENDMYQLLTGNQQKLYDKFIAKAGINFENFVKKLETMKDKSSNNMNIYLKFKYILENNKQPKKEEFKKFKLKEKYLKADVKTNLAAIRPPPRTMNPALLVIKNKVDNEQFFSSKLSSPSSKASSKASSSSKASYKSSSSGGYNQASPQYV